MLTIAHLIDTLLIFLLQISGVMAFFDSLIFTHILLAATALISVYILAIEAIRNKNTDAKHLLQGLLIMVVFGLAELLYFYLFDYVQVSFFLRTGVLLFVAILSIQSIHRVGKTRRMLFQAELYEKLAFTDQLTKAPNRTAFDRDLYLLFDKPPAEQIHVGFFDLNNLKTINDVFGHNYGDEAIIKSYAVIQEVFSQHGCCYRIGGDEFACILHTIDLSTITSLAQTLDQKTASIDNEVSYPFVLAQGYAKMDKQKQTSLDALMHEADQEMYENKAYKKAAYPLNASLNKPVS